MDYLQSGLLYLIFTGTEHRSLLPALTGQHHSLVAEQEIHARPAAIPAVVAVIDIGEYRYSIFCYIKRRISERKNYGKGIGHAAFKIVVVGVIERKLGCIAV